MTKLQRRYELLIGDPYKIVKEDIPKASFITAEGKLAAVEEGIRKANEDRGGFKISGLHMEFSIEKTKSGLSPNTANLKIANLSDKVVRYLENRTGKKTIILLKCAYGDEPLKTVFLGNVEKYKDNFSQETRWTEIFIADAGANHQGTLTSRYYPKGTSVDTIVSDMIGDLKLPKAGGFVAKTGEQTKKDFYFNGNVYDQLHRLATFYNYNYCVQDGTVFFMPIGVGRKKWVALISPDTGLIGEVSTLDATDGTSQNSSDTNPGIKFTTLLDGNLLPEMTVKVESRNKTGVYKISKVTHKGSFEGTAWYSEVEAEEVTNTI